jgi:hypothetical protein
MILEYALPTFASHQCRQSRSLTLRFLTTASALFTNERIVSVDLAGKSRPAG